MQKTGSLSLKGNCNYDSHMILFFTIISQKEAGEKVFDELDGLSQRLPTHEVIKCVVEESLSEE